MADFCNKCAKGMGFDEDFNIEKIFEDLQEGYYYPVLCEGCALTAIRKEKGEMKLIAMNGKKWQTKEEFFSSRGVK